MMQRRRWIPVVLLLVAALLIAAPVSPVHASVALGQKASNTTSCLPSGCATTCTSSCGTLAIGTLTITTDTFAIVELMYDTSGGNTPTLTISDSQSNTWTTQQNGFSAGNNLGLLLATAFVTAGSDTFNVGVTFSVADRLQCACAVSTWSSVNTVTPVEASNKVTQNGVTSISLTFNSLQTGWAIVGGASSRNSPSFTPGTGQTQVTSYNAAGTCSCVGDLEYISPVNAASFTYSESLSSSQNPWLAAVVLNDPPPTISSVSPSSGFTGTQITVSGSSFLGATSVTICGITVSQFTVVSDSSITTVAPFENQGGIVCDIQVTTPSGTSSLSSSDQFTYKNSGGPPPGSSTSPTPVPDPTIPIIVAVIGAVAVGACVVVIRRK